MPADALAQVYVFENGVAGKGPLGFQPDVFDNPPGTAGYTPAQHHPGQMGRSGQAREFKSVADVMAARRREVTIGQPGWSSICRSWSGTAGNAESFTSRCPKETGLQSSPAPGSHNSGDGRASRAKDGHSIQPLLGHGHSREPTGRPPRARRWARHSGGSSHESCRTQLERLWWRSSPCWRRGQPAHELCPDGDANGAAAEAASGHGGGDRGAGNGRAGNGGDRAHGDGRRQRPAAARPDHAVVWLGVETQAQSASQALSQNSQQMQRLLAALAQAGVAREDTQTRTVNLAPQYPQNPQPLDQPTPPAVTGFIATNSLQVRVRQLEKLGQLLDAAVQNGANQIQSVRFEISDPERALEQARRAAWQDALNKAMSLASLGGAQLGRVLHINEGGSGFAPQPMLAAGQIGGYGGAVPIEPGSEEVQVSLQATWALVGGTVGTAGVFGTPTRPTMTPWVTPTPATTRVPRPSGGTPAVTVSPTATSAIGAGSKQRTATPQAMLTSPVATRPGSTGTARSSATPTTSSAPTGGTTTSTPTPAPTSTRLLTPTATETLRPSAGQAAVPRTPGAATLAWSRAREGRTHP